jgi:hypothetical protein
MVSTIFVMACIDLRRREVLITPGDILLSGDNIVVVVVVAVRILLLFMIKNHVRSSFLFYLFVYLPW